MERVSRDQNAQEVVIAWPARAEELARWAEATLVNRYDIHGGQRVDSDGTIRRRTSHESLTFARLARHFSAGSVEDVIGLHSAAPDETCRWIGVDIDNHGGGASAEGNFRFAREIRNRAARVGLPARLLDSSGGRGGYHIWIAFDPPIPMADARRLLLWLVRDWGEFGLPRRPDLFPSNDHLTGKRCGTWLRIPGRHHKRPDWAEVWSPRRRAWLSGDEAIDSLLRLRGRPADVAAIVPADFRPGPIRSSTGRRPRRVDEAPSARPNRHGRAGWDTREARLAEAALESYSNDDLDYDDWIEVGMALKDLDDDAVGFALWDRWSASSGKYDAGLTAAKWASFRPARCSGGVGLGTLFRHAKLAGWEGPAFDVIVDDRGIRRATHRSGLGGTISIPLSTIAAGRADSVRAGDAPEVAEQPGEVEAPAGGTPIHFSVRVERRAIRARTPDRVQGSHRRFASSGRLDLPARFAKANPDQPE